MTKKILCLMGPTATGKTNLALALAKEFPIEIISVDSALIYREMDIGTAKPTSEERATVPHHLIDIKDPSEAYSAAEFCRDVKNLIPDIKSRGRTPLLVGGTMLYFRALQEGLSDLPSADLSIRDAIAQRAALKGWPALHEALLAIDPHSAQKIHPRDKQRIQRALEVYEMTGTPMSVLQQQQENSLEAEWISIGLVPQNREQLHEHIAVRLDTMLAAGFLEEVKRLRARGDLTLDMPSMRCVGYRQAWEYLEGSGDYFNFREKALAATRQFAKRQLTWLRTWPDLIMLESYQHLEKSLTKFKNYFA